MDRNKKYKYTVITTGITISGLLISAINGIVGFIAVYFFKPIWEKLIRWWNNER